MYICSVKIRILILKTQFKRVDSRIYFKRFIKGIAFNGIFRIPKGIPFSAQINRKSVIISESFARFRKQISVSFIALFKINLYRCLLFF